MYFGAVIKIILILTATIIKFLIILNALISILSKIKSIKQLYKTSRFLELLSRFKKNININNIISLFNYSRIICRI